MINLYTLPGLAFNSPSLSVPLIKGYLKENNITTKQYDLTQKFFERCVNSNYLKKHKSKYYNSLKLDEKSIIDNIDKSIQYMKSRRINTDKIIDSNEIILEYLKIYGNCYNIIWNKKGLSFNTQLDTIDKVIDYSLKMNSIIFDDLYDIKNLSDGDIVYMSIQQPFQLVFALRFSKKIKEKSNKIKVIFGGDYITHIIANSEELMKKFKYIDSILFYGELKFLIELIDYYKNNSTSNISNVYLRKEEKIIKNKIEECNEYDKQKYIPTFENLNLNGYLSNLKMVNMTLNYGCYHSKCKFCSRYYYYNGKGRYNLDKIFKLIKELYLNEKIEAIYFIDECVPPEILIKLANFLIHNNIKIKWMVETRIDKKLLDKRISKLLYESGLREISFGIESISKKVLQSMDKRIEINDAKEIMKNFYLSGISVSGTFMIGYPTENFVDRYRTLRFIKKFKYIDTFGLGVFTYMRNSILVNESDLDVSKDLNLIYRLNNDKYDDYMNLIRKFNNTKKIKKYSEIRNKILYRSEYMYLDRKKYSLNFK